jgi:hypothetical protein
MAITVPQDGDNISASSFGAPVANWINGNVPGIVNGVSIPADQLLIQTATQVVTTSNAGNVVTFPRVFSTIPLVMVTVGFMYPGMMAMNENLTVNSFTVYCYDSAGVLLNGGAFRFNWLAIGKA